MKWIIVAALILLSHPVLALTSTVPVNSPAASSNCPSTPPPPAARAGFTTLAYCFDPANSSLFATPSTWQQCAIYTSGHGQQHWWGGYIDSDCGVGGRGPTMYQNIDPETGKTVLDFHWHNDIDSYSMNGCPNLPTPCILPFFNGCNMYGPCGPSAVLSTVGTSPGYPNPTSGAGWVTFPRAHYIELKFRQDPPYLPAWAFGNCCAPDFFTWSAEQAYWEGGYTNDGLLPSTNETDILETVLGSSMIDGVSYGPTTGPGAGFWAGNYGTTAPLWNANFSDGSTLMQHQHTYGNMITMDPGLTRLHACWYWDAVVVKGPPGDTFTKGCFDVDSDHNIYGAGRPWDFFKVRQYIILWLAGGMSKKDPFCKSSWTTTDGPAPDWNQNCWSDLNNWNNDTHTYIEYIAVWECAAWNNYDTGLGYDSQPPCALGVAE